jgi:hypothetical protein
VRSRGRRPAKEKSQEAMFSVQIAVKGRVIGDLLA